MTVTAPARINPSVLRWARERLSLPKVQVAALSTKLGKHYTAVEPSELRQWEHGIGEPDLESLETLSEIYVCPVGYFFLPSPPTEATQLNFRGITAEKEERLSGESRRTLRKFVDLAEWTVLLIEDLGIDWSVEIGAKITDVEDLVLREQRRLGFDPGVRSQWVNADEAFTWWRRRIESQGIFCFQMKLNPKEIRGASLWVDSQYPFALVNHQDAEAATGRTFTLLHEYAHLLTGRESLVCDFRGRAVTGGPEPSANRFAARMLLAYDELREKLAEMEAHQYRGSWSDQLLDEIRKPFFVSRDVVAIALEDLELAPEGFYRKKREQWDARRPGGKGGRGRRPTNRERKFREIGFSLTRLLTHRAAEEKASLADLSYVLEMKVEKVSDFLRWARDKAGGAG